LEGLCRLPGAFYIKDHLATLKDHLETLKDRKLLLPSQANHIGLERHKWQDTVFRSTLSTTAVTKVK